MQSQWHQFLEQQGARIDNEGQCVFNDQHSVAEQVENSNVLCPVYDRGLIAIEGPDSGKFLQGQLTCDVRSVTPQQTALGAHCTPKGRMVNSFRLASTSAETFLMSMHRSIIERSRQSLGKYIVFSKAELYDRSNEYVTLGVAGPSAADSVMRCFPQLPKQLHHSVLQDGSLLIQIDVDAQRFEIWCPAAKAPAIWQSLAQSMTPASSDCWQLLDIRQGLGQVREQTVEMFIPQMLNYQLVEAISFTKGCYTGQEIIARMQYRGKLKRHMYHVALTLEATANLTLVQPGAPLYADGDEQSCGDIVQCVKTTPSNCELLVVLTDQALEQQAIHIAGKSGPKVQMLSLPYAIYKDDQSISATSD